MANHDYETSRMTAVLAAVDPVPINNLASYVNHKQQSQFNHHHHSADWLDAAAGQFEGASTRESASFMATMNGRAADEGKLAARLIVRLINETFLSLPLVNCLGIESEYGRSSHTAAQQQLTDVCRVDWQQAKLVQDLAPNKPSEQSELLLSNLLASASSLFNRSNNFEHLNTIPQNSTFNQPLIDYNLLKLSYLSISSLLSICGILINLFIILIIIFNTKQKRRSILRSNNTGQNNLLLFQLTITGILLTSYVLLDNMDIQNQSSPSFQQSLSKFAQTLTQLNSDQTNLLMSHSHHRRDRTQGVEDLRFCGFIYQLPSLLFTFLPPTPFHWNGTKLCSLSDPDCKQIMAHSVGFQGSEVNSENDRNDPLVVKENAPALVLTFNSVWKKTSPATSLSNHSRPVQSWFLDYYTETLGDRSIGLIDITSSIKSMFVTNAECKHYGDVPMTQESVNPFVGGLRDVASNSTIVFEEYSNLRYIKSMASSLCPLLINVIAFIHIWTVAALAYDRYCAIAHPLQYLRSINASKTRTFFIISWSAALTLNLIAPIALNHFLMSSPNRTAPVETINVDRLSGDYHKTTQSTIFGDQIDGVDYNGECNFFEPLSSNLVKSTNEQRISPYQLVHHRFLRSETEQSDKNPREIKAIKPIIDLAILLMRLSTVESHRINGEAKRRFDETSSQDFKENLYIAILLIYSLVGFGVVILVPLLIITICNIRIYRIVKVHERRLSINSGSNVAHNFDSTSQRQHKYETNSEDRSEEGSITSLLMNKLVKLVRAPSGQDNLGCNDHGDGQKCLSTCKADCKRDCALLNANKIDLITKISESKYKGTSVVTRSKKISRQDSCRLLTRLAISDKNCSLGDIKLGMDHSDYKNYHYNGLNRQLTLNGDLHLSTCSTGMQVSKIKRKISGHFNASEVRRKSSTLSHFEFCEQKDSRNDTHSCNESPLNYNNDDHTKNESESIINQLKLAGLSFAGIAIQEPSPFANRTLQKSSSCSLGNLSFNNQWSQYHENCSSSVLRCSIDTTSTVICPKKSYISLNTPTKQHDELITSSTKYQTRLADDADGGQGQNGTTINFHHNHNRLPFTIGTKSAAFNVVIWLILTMLIFTLPNYILVTIDQIRKLNSGSELINQDDLDAYTQRLGPLINLALGSPANRSDRYLVGKKFSTGDSLLQVSSVWLSCLCRILFLSMVPLNGWLYGIRSKSLKASIKVVLKRYISKKQASIEIDQRQRSISSLRSRDSSFMNLSQLFNQHCQHRASSSENSHRARRCSSLNTSRPDGLSHRNSVHLVNNFTADDPSKVMKEIAHTSDLFTPLETDSKLSKGQANDGIRFSIGDSYTTESDDGSTPQTSVVSAKQQRGKKYRCSSLNTSPTLSLASSSSKSLVSTSMHSPQSLLEDRMNQKYSQFKRETQAHEMKGTCEQHHLGFELVKAEGKQRRHSATESSTKSSSKTPANYLDDGRHVKKSSSEFKFLITSADQHEQHLIEFNNQQLDERSPLKGVDTVVHYEESTQKRATLRNTNDQPPNEWWKDLKQNLTRLLISASTRFLAHNLVKDDKGSFQDAAGNCCNSARNQMNCRPARNSCQMSLIRRNSDNYSHVSTKWRKNLTISTWNPDLKNKESPSTKIRNSVTMNNIDAANSGSSGRHETHLSLYEQTNGSAQSPTYLKPPNFLKLIFDSNNHAQPYSGASALSPIKECSSNHLSYASSQSSLNNNIPLIGLQTTSG